MCASSPSIRSRASQTCALAVNGEIYNHLDIRKELKNPGQVLTDSDCEVILHMYEEGASPQSMCDRLNGIFGFVLYDEKKALMRAHMHIAPLPSRHASVYPARLIFLQD